jgi:enamine deaminase RidA (YjgF/YER057c/UK114 family)
MSDHDRRSFLQHSALASVGALGAGALVGHAVPTMAAGATTRILVQGGPEQRIRDLGITLPEPGRPFATLVPTVISGNMLFTSGTGPRGEDGRPVTGKVGADVTPEIAKAAARGCGLSVLANVRAALGTLDRVARLVKTFGMVNSAPDFTGQSNVINGFSELMIEVFGEELGKGARSAVGMASLPGGWCLEIEAIFEIRAG